MPVREKKIYCKEFLEVEIYPITLQEKKQKRKKKEKVSAPKQKNLNDKNAKKYLKRLLNTNFDDNDLALHLTYDRNNLPSSYKEAKKDVDNFLRRLKNYRKKIGLETLKYISVIEYKEPSTDKRKSIRMHHHLIINGGIDRDVVEKIWKKGRANADRLQKDENGYEALAKYITKDPQGKKRWSQSRNLKKPVIKVNDNKYSKKKLYVLSRCQGDREEIQKLYPGYSLTKYEVKVNDITGAVYIYLDLRKIII